MHIIFKRFPWNKKAKDVRGLFAVFLLLLPQTKKQITFWQKPRKSKTVVYLFNFCWKFSGAVFSLPVSSSLQEASQVSFFFSGSLHKPVLSFTNIKTLNGTIQFLLIPDCIVFLKSTFIKLDTSAIKSLILQFWPRKNLPHECQMLRHQDQANLLLPWSSLGLWHFRRVWFGVDSGKILCPNGGSGGAGWNWLGAPQLHHMPSWHPLWAPSCPPELG